MKYKRFGKGILAAAAIAALVLALAACGDGNVAPSPTGAGPNPSTQPIVTPTLMPGGSPSPTGGDAGNPQTTTVPGNPNAATSFDPGTYTAKAKGMNGDVTVEVVFSDTAIVSIQVTNHKETEGIYEKAVDEVPQSIVGGQTLDVDTVSGATYTSNAIIEAVTDCVTQAGGDVSALGGKTPNGANKSPSPSP